MIGDKLKKLDNAGMLIVSLQGYYALSQTVLIQKNDFIGWIELTSSVQFAFGHFFQEGRCPLKIFMSIPPI
jgi:hypothetical protein